MTEHYTRNTISVTVWCNKCQRNTTHRVDGGRRGPCMEHEAKDKSKDKTFYPPKNDPNQKNLFEK